MTCCLLPNTEEMQEHVLDRRKTRTCAYIDLHVHQMKDYLDIRLIMSEGLVRVVIVMMLTKVSRWICAVHGGFISRLARCTDFIL